MMLSFIDSGVLIAAATGQADIAELALEVLDDPSRSFASSEFVRLEVLPKAEFHNQHSEAEFYKSFFSEVADWPADHEITIQEAYRHGVRYGLSAMDALHLAAAIQTGADELITTERTEKPLHRATELPIRSLHTGVV